MTSEVAYTPRERGSHSPTKVTSWWIDGSRDRYGEAYFITTSTLVQTGRTSQTIHLWQNRRPYAPNVEISKTVRDSRPTTWAEIDKMMHPSVVKFDAWSGNR